MKQANIETRGAVLSAVFIVLWESLVLLLLGWLMLTQTDGEPVARVILLAVMIPYIAVIIGTIAVLTRRIRQMQKELEELGKVEFHMLLVNTATIAGKELEMLGLVKGSTVRSKNLGRDFMAAMKTLVGGELHEYQELLLESRQIATKRMVDEAEAMGADAVVNVRYGTSSVMQGAAEILVYGTAVKFK